MGGTDSDAGEGRWKQSRRQAIRTRSEERKDANTKLYGRPVAARVLLTGGERPPPQTAPLLNILNSRVFSGHVRGSMDDHMYNDIPVYDSSRDNVVWGERTGSSYGDDQHQNQHLVNQRHPSRGMATRARLHRDCDWAARLVTGEDSDQVRHAEDLLHQKLKV